VYAEHPPVKAKDGYNSVCITKLELDPGQYSLVLVKGLYQRDVPQHTEMLKMFLICFWEKHYYFASDYLDDSQAQSITVPFKIKQRDNCLWVFYYYNATQRNPKYLWRLLRNIPFSYKVVFEALKITC
jgi:hypothetical protein